MKHLLLLLVILGCPPVLADTVRVAVASNFKLTMETLADEFEATTGHEVVISAGSSGKFVAQIQLGAPFDIFLSADQVKPQALEDANLVLAGSRRTYAVGALVLWSPGQADDPVTRLKSGDFKRLAIANPRLAPYGQAAMEVLEYFDLLESTRTRLVQGENISQTYQFVMTRNADLGFIALSQVNSMSDKGTRWRVPAQFYSPIRQDLVLLKSSADNPAAHALLDFLKSSQAINLISSHGYDVPDLETMTQ